MPIAEEFWKLCTGVTQGEMRSVRAWISFHMRLLFLSYHSNLDKEDFFSARLASLTHLLFQQRTKSNLRGKWTSKANGRMREWAPCSVGPAASVRSGEQTSTLTRCSGLTLPNTIKTDDDEDTAVTWKQHDDCLTPSVYFLFGLINVHRGTKTPCDRAQESLTQIPQLEWITAPWSTWSRSQLRQSLIETRP